MEPASIKPEITDAELEAIETVLHRVIQAYRELQVRYADVLTCLSTEQEKYTAIAHEYQNRLEGQLHDALAERDALKAKVAPLEAMWVGGEWSMIARGWIRCLRDIMSNIDGFELGLILHGVTDRWTVPAIDPDM